MSSTSRTPSLTPSRSSTPEPPPQPDHFYGSNVQLPPSPHSDGRTWLSPEDDPLAHRGIPVFKPSLEEFEDFEQYMIKIECWGMRSGIVKVIPPKEWTGALPSLKPQLQNVKIRTPIEQHMLGSGGLFRQENMEKRKVMSVREWAELCSKEDFRAPGVDDVGLHARSANVKPRTKKSKKKADTVKTELADVETEIRDDQDDEDQHIKDINHQIQHSEQSCAASPPDSAVDASPATPRSEPGVGSADSEVNPEDKAKPKPKRVGQTKEAREASLADRASKDLAFLETFSPHEDWLPPNTKPSDYSPEFCQKLERQYWRNCGLGKPAWYGADTQGSLYTDETKSWNVAHLPSTLSRLLPPGNGLPGVNTPYLYFGMWRATFAWHVEDMDLFSINYVHFGAPKFWYASPQGRASALEQTMRGYFPKDTSRCPQFLRHKSFLASPTLLAQSSCRPNHLVQHAGEFVITFPRGYHAGFNLGFNCAESVNFALDSWIELGKRAKACECISDSVRIDVEQLLRDRAVEMEPEWKKNPNDESPKPKKRKSEAPPHSTKSKKPKTKLDPKPSLPKISLTLKIGPRPPEQEEFPCCLCVSTNREGLLPVHDPPVGRKDIEELAGKPKVWMAHESCANVIPETWVDEVDEGLDGFKQRFVFGVDAVVKDRWNLKCSACTKTRNKAHGAPVQCTKGKCPKAFHVSCAREGQHTGIVFTVLKEVEKEVVLVDSAMEVPQEAMQIDTSVLDQVDIAAILSDAVMIPGPVVGGSGESECNPAHVSDSRVLKVIKKQEVEILCTQHNPTIAAAKRANKQDKIRTDLLALPSMARIKIRVSAGVFEVSLIRVIEETNSVEVLWDRGIKREFKWGSVVFGNTGADVQQKPAEMLAEPEQPSQSAAVQTYASIAATRAQVDESPVGARTTQPQHANASYYYHSRPGHYGYWPYQGTGLAYAAGSQPYPYGYYAAAGSINHSSYMYSASQCRSGQLSWQQPYQGPRLDGSTPAVNPTATASQPGVQQSPANMADLVPNDGSTAPSGQPTTSPENTAPQAQDVPLSSVLGQISTDDTLAKPGDEQNFLKDLVALSSMQPSQIADVLRDNPQLRDIVWAAFDQVKKASMPTSE